VSNNFEDVKFGHFEGLKEILGEQDNLHGNKIPGVNISQNSPLFQRGKVTLFLMV
jgi:hypothetical protein